MACRNSEGFQQAKYDEFAKVQFPLAANGMSPILYLRVQRDQGTI